MANFKSETVTLGSPAESVYNKLSNLGSLRELLANMPADKVPEDKRQMLENIEITDDTITIPGGPAGAITLKMAQKTPFSLIRMEGEGTPVPLSLMMHLNSMSGSACEASVEIDIKVPMLVVPMIKGPLQQIVDQFAQVLRSIPMA